MTMESLFAVWSVVAIVWFICRAVQENRRIDADIAREVEVDHA